MVSDAIAYCATKFYVSSFTEGLAQELALKEAKLKAKILAPAAAETELAKIAMNLEEFTYTGNFNIAEELGKFTIDLYDSSKVIGIINTSTHKFELLDPKYPFRHTTDTKGK